VVKSRLTSKKNQKQNYSLLKLYLVQCGLESADCWFSMGKTPNINSSLLVRPGILDEVLNGIDGRIVQDVLGAVEQVT